MRPRTFRLTEAEATELQEAFQHCHDARAKTRYQAVRLYGTGYRVEHILDVCACNRTSLLEWAHAYRQRGLSALLDHRQGGNRALLTAEQVEAVQTRLHRYMPAQLFGHDRCVGSGLFWTVPDVARLLERDYGVTYQSHTSYRTLLQKCGLSFQRPAKQYKSHSEVKLMDFQERLEKKTGGHRSGRAADSHPGRR